MADKDITTATVRLTPVQWLICAMAAIGFAFDIYEILMLPLIVRPALLELTGAAPGSPEFQMWVGRLFYIPAFAGGSSACSAAISRISSAGAFFGLGEGLPDPHAPWRYTLMSGVLPALPLLLIRPFLPESPAWQQKKAAGTLKRPSIAALFAPALRRTTIVTTIMFAMAYGAAFGAIQQIPQIVPGLPEVREATAAMPPPQEARINQEVAADVTKVQEVGGLAGRILLAYLAVMSLSRGTLIRLFQIPGLIVMPLGFGLAATSSLSWLYPAIFLAGLFTVGQFSFWGNYLPRVYPLHLRGTGESFAANIGGRLVGTSFAWLTATLATTADRAAAPGKLALVAAAVGFFVYLAGFAASFWLPEPPARELEDDEVQAR